MNPLDLFDWRQIEHAPNYWVSRDGRIWNRSRSRLVQPYKANRPGHLRVDLGRRNKHWVHRLVAAAFIGPPPEERPFVMHLDGDPTNNCVENLCYGSGGENTRHHFRGEVPSDVPF